MMTVEVKVNDKLIEKFGIHRLDSLTIGGVSTYAVGYERYSEHPTARWPQSRMMLVRHNYDDGSLPLVKACVEAAIA